MVADINTIYQFINILGAMEGQMFWVLDNVTLYTSNGYPVTVLDGFLIAAFIFDLSWELLEDFGIL